MLHGKLATDGIRSLTGLGASLAAGLTELFLARTLRTRLFYRMLQASHGAR